MKDFPNRHWHVCNVGLKKEAIQGPLSSTQLNSKGSNQENLDVCLREAKLFVMGEGEKLVKDDTRGSRVMSGKIAHVHTYLQREKQTYHVCCFCVYMKER